MAIRYSLSFCIRTSTNIIFQGNIHNALNDIICQRFNGTLIGGHTLLLIRFLIWTVPNFITSHPHHCVVYIKWFILLRAARFYLWFDARFRPKYIKKKNKLKWIDTKNKKLNISTSSNIWIGMGEFWVTLWLSWFKA